MSSPISYKLKNGQTRYKISVYGGIDDNGKQINFNKQGFKTKAQANRWAAMKRTEVAVQGLPSDEQNRSVNEVYEEWLEKYKTTVCEITCLKVKRLFANHFLPAVGNKNISKINKLDYQNIIDLMYEKTPGDFKKNFNYFKKMMIESGAKIPDGLVFPAAKKTIPKKVTYTKSELNTFLEATKKHRDRRCYPYFRLLAYSGLRKSEAGALMKDCVNYEEHTITVKRAFSRDEKNQPILSTPKNKSSNRTIAIDKETLQALKSIETDSDFIFGDDFNSTNAPRRWLHEVCKTIDLNPITIHGFRHTHCSLLFEAGATVKEVQNRLGHTNPEMTIQVYTHISNKQAKNIPDKFVSFMSST